MGKRLIGKILLGFMSAMLVFSTAFAEDAEMTSMQRKQDVICLKVNENLAIKFGEMTNVDENSQVVPYLLNDRTLVPLRFVSEALGAEVLWEEEWNGCIIKKDDTEIKITFDSAEFLVNGEKKVYDAPIQVVHGRTMVPVRFVSEELNHGVYWNEPNEVVVIYPMDNPWIMEREAENVALNEMVITLVFNLFGI